MKRAILIILASFFFTSNLCLLAQANQKDYYKTLHWVNSISPEEYVKAYYYIQNDMRTFKQSHNNIQGQNKWIPFGPKQVIDKFNPENVFHGRIRAIKWWYNKEGDIVPYIGSSSGGLWYGNNEILLRNWESVGDNSPNPSISAIEMRRGCNKRAWICDNGDSNIAYVITNESPYRIYEINSSGDFLKDLTGNLPAVRKYDIVKHRNQAYTYYVATDLGIFVTFNDGDEWFSYQEGLPIVSAQSFSYQIGNITDTLRVATFGRGLWMRPLEAGDSKFEITDVDVNLSAIAAGFDSFGDTKTAIATSSTGQVLISDNTFDTYSFKQTTFFTSNFTSISLYRTGMGYFGTGALCGTNGLVAFTTDRGVNWTKSTGVPNHSMNDIHISPSGIGFFCDDSGYVYKTYDSGKSWKTEIIKYIYMIITEIKSLIFTMVY